MADKTLGPADEQAFLSKLSSVFYDQMEKLRKAPKPLSREDAVSQLCEAFQQTLPAKKLGGMGTDKSMSDKDMESMAEDDSEDGEEEADSKE